MLAAGLGAAWLATATGAAAAPPYDGYVESAVYPIRVHYTTAAGPEAAQEVLGYAEEGWETQIVQMGFPVPTAVNDQDERVTGLWIYLDPAHGMDHPEAIGDNPDTPWTDCTTRIRISTLAPSSYLRLVTHHEMNHVLEYSADCGEPPFTIEQTTVAVTTINEPDDTVFPEYMLPVFQQNPHNSLHCTFYYNQAKFYFHYGSALFQIFLEDAYGDYDGTLLAGIWEASKQNGSVTSVGGAGAVLDVPNEPNIFDGMEAALDGVTLEQAYAEFARWRTFVGTRDDGAHFRDGSKWPGGEVAVDTTLTLQELPIVQGATQNQPNELGSVYVSLDPFGIAAEQGVRLIFDGDDAVSWQVDALLVREDHTADIETMTLSEQSWGELVLGPLTDYVEVLLAFTNLGDGTRDPALPHCSSGNGFVYELSLVDLAAPPQLSSVEPSELTVGQDHYLWLGGSDFAAGLQAAFSGEGMEVTAVDFIDSETAGIAVTVAAEAQLGARDLTVTNDNGDSATLSGAVTLVAPAQPAGSEAGSEDSSSCACTTPGSSRPQPLSWGLALLLGGMLSLAARRGRKP